MPRSYNPLAEFLISLANPRNLRAYRRNPNAYLQRFGVSAADRTAIASASAAAIRRRARGAGNVPGTIGRRPVPSGIFEIAEIAEIREIAEVKEIVEIREIGEIKEIVEIREIAEIKEIVEIREIGEIKEILEFKEI